MDWASQNIYEEVPSSRSRLGWCIHGLLKHTVIYVTFWSPKLRGQFSENLVLWIYEFLFILVIAFSKKKIIEVLRIKNLKYDRNVQLTNCFFLINTILFVCIKQTSKTEVQKQPSNEWLKVGVPRENLKSRKNPWKKLWRSSFLVKL